jgi:hypothetical protein
MSEPVSSNGSAGLASRYNPDAILPEGREQYGLSTQPPLGWPGILEMIGMSNTVRVEQTS